jgi:hypothetical protein
MWPVCQRNQGLLVLIAVIGIFMLSMRVKKDHAKFENERNYPSLFQATYSNWRY